MKYFIVIFTCTLFFGKINSYKEPQYFREPNEPYKRVTIDNIHGNSVFKTIDRPFRMAKLNLVWTKAQHVSKFAFSSKENWYIIKNV